jgi:prepilin-type N-terminal cleavage/methylation domain-containing protein
MSKRKRQKGFTIIEVMLVMLIMGVLASLVAPTIRLNAARAKMSEALQMFGTCRNLITETYLLADALPAEGEWGCESNVGDKVSQYVDRIRVDAQGVIKVDLGGFSDLRLDHHTITLAPLDGSGNVMSTFGRIARWRCGSGIDGTDLDLKFLPGSCTGT